MSKRFVVLALTRLTAAATADESVSGDWRVEYSPSGVSVIRAGELPDAPCVL